MNKVIILGRLADKSVYRNDGQYPNINFRVDSVKTFQGKEYKTSISCQIGQKQIDAFNAMNPQAGDLMSIEGSLKNVKQKDGAWTMLVSVFNFDLVGKGSAISSDTHPQSDMDQIPF